MSVKLRSIRRTHHLPASWPARIAFTALLVVLAHTAYHAAIGLGTGMPLAEAIPVWEKPIADLGKGIGTLFGRWIPDWSLVTPLGPFSLSQTVSYVIYEWIKLPTVLFLTTFGMGLLRRKVGARAFGRTLGREDWLGAVGGAVAGMFTPVCSCTVAPLYAGLVAGGASRKASAAFLFASPALNSDGIYGARAGAESPGVCPPVFLARLLLAVVYLLLSVGGRLLGCIGYIASTDFRNRVKWCAGWSSEELQLGVDRDNAFCWPRMVGADRRCPAGPSLRYQRSRHGTDPYRFARRGANRNTHQCDDGDHSCLHPRSLGVGSLGGEECYYTPSGMVCCIYDADWVNY